MRRSRWDPLAYASGTLGRVMGESISATNHGRMEPQATGLVLGGSKLRIPARQIQKIGIGKMGIVGSREQILSAPPATARAIFSLRYYCAFTLSVPIRPKRDSFSFTSAGIIDWVRGCIPSDLTEDGKSSVGRWHPCADWRATVHRPLALDRPAPRLRVLLPLLANVILEQNERDILESF